VAETSKALRFPARQETPARITSGNRDMDQILNGGFPVNSINIVMGQPGTGKTVWTEQLVFANAQGDRPIVYLTTLTEPLAKVVRYLQDFSFFDESKLGQTVLYEDFGPELARDGVDALIPRLKEIIFKLSPKIVVIDSYKALSDLADDAATLRRLVFALTGLLTAYDTTAFLLGEYREDDIPRYPEFAAADGVVELSRRKTGSRDERYFRVFKLRGSGYREGAHAFRITKDGLEVFPRLVSPSVPLDYRATLERAPTGVAGLDEMTNGGFWQGSSTLLAGPPGAGKTTIALQFAIEGALTGQPTLYVHFQENPTQLARSLHMLRPDLRGATPKLLEFIYTSPVELQIDSIIVQMFRRITQEGIRRVVIDALGDLANAADDPQRLHDYLYALMQHFAVNKVTSLLTLETGSKLSGVRHEPMASLVDNFILLGMEGTELTHRTVRVIKTRGSSHDPRVREIEITRQGVGLI
jgi:circadian clock protein KaiC